MKSLRRTIDRQLLGYAREAVYATNGAVSRHHHEKQFVIFGRGRSGSTLLVDLLNSNPNIYCDGEILNRKLISPLGHIRNCSKMHKARIYGFKLLSYQLRSIQNIPDPEEFLELLVEDYGYKMIFITRQNLLRQTLSKHYANFRNSWHEKGKSVSRPLMHVDIPQLLRNLDEGYQLGTFEQKVVSHIDHLPLSYEENLSSPEKQEDTLLKVSEFLGIEPFQGQSHLKKITGSRYSDFIENVEEMVRAIEPTPYAAYLEY